MTLSGQVMRGRSESSLSSDSSPKELSGLDFRPRSVLIETWYNCFNGIATICGSDDAAPNKAPKDEEKKMTIPIPSSENLVPSPSNDHSTFTPAFPAAEYESRLEKLRETMRKEGFDAAIIAAPANLCYYSGLTGSSSYVPQYLLLTVNDTGGALCEQQTKLLMRPMDAPAARCTTYFPPEDCIMFSESYIDHPDRTPVELLKELIMSAVTPFFPSSQGRAGKASRKIRVAAEFGKNGLTGQEVLELLSWTSNVPTSSKTASKAEPVHFDIVDATPFIRKQRLIKSELELQKIREAAAVVDEMMKTCVLSLLPGKSTAFASGEANRVQRALGGCQPAMDPMLKANEQGAHMMCNQAPLVPEDYVSIEIGGAVDHYHCPLSRCKILMSKEELAKDVALRNSMEAVCYCMEKTLSFVKPGVTAHDVYWVFEKAFNERGYSKKSRIAYSFGIGFPPGWGDEIMSVYDGDMTVIEKNMVLHFIIGCGSNAGPGDGGSGCEESSCADSDSAVQGNKKKPEYAAALSEPVVVTATGVERLSKCPREIFCNDSFSAS